MISKYDGKCSQCQARFTAGTEIVYCYETRKAQCSDMGCTLQSRAAKPVQAPKAPAAPVSTHPVDQLRDEYEAAMKARDEYETYLQTARLRDWNLARTNVQSMKITERNAFNAWMKEKSGISLSCHACQRVVWTGS